MHPPAASSEGTAHPTCALGRDWTARPPGCWSFTSRHVGTAPQRLDTLGKHLLLEGVLSSGAQWGELPKTEKLQSSWHKGLALSAEPRSFLLGPPLSAWNRNTSRKVLCSRHPSSVQSLKPCPNELSASRLSFCLAGHEHCLLSRLLKTANKQT